ncbi:hypothetical protein [Streptomyces tritici]|uniref:hypothetical protein n=1 Tax=Streptomyces tritici TaxID=2054410 RepID=UPI003AF120D8
MGDNDFCASLLSLRELGSVEASIRSAKSRAEVSRILDGHELTTDEFADTFPDLAKTVQELPDDTFPAP